MLIAFIFKKKALLDAFSKYCVSIHHSISVNAADPYDWRPGAQHLCFGLCEARVEPAAGAKRFASNLLSPRSRAARTWSCHRSLLTAAPSPGSRAPAGPRGVPWRRVLNIKIRLRPAPYHCHHRLQPSNQAATPTLATAC